MERDKFLRLPLKLCQYIEKSLTHSIRLTRSDFDFCSEQLSRTLLLTQVAESLALDFLSVFAFIKKHKFWT